MKVFKKNNLLGITTALIMGLNSASAQTTIVLQPSADQGKDAVLGSLASSTNYSAHPEFLAMAGTSGGTLMYARSLIEFDFTSLPKGAVINSAKLSLYSYDSSTNGKHRMDGGANEATLSRVTTAWSEDSVTWNNQPGVSTVNQVTLAGSDSTIQHYLDIDVTSLVTDMTTDSTGNNGFLFQLVTEQKYRTMLFASSDYADSTLHPKLEINYTKAAEPCVALRPGASAGKDAVLSSLASGTNYGDHTEFVALEGTSGGTPATLRSLLQFDLSGIPSGAIIDSAKLSLYSLNSPGNGKHRLDGGSNEATISRVTSAWSEDSVTWDNQPITSTVNQVTLAGSDSLIQHYLNIDVTGLVSGMTSDSIGNNGFLFKLVTEVKYLTMMFASSDNADSTLHPMLEVCYSIITETGKISVNSSTALVYPNPTSGQFTVNVEDEVNGNTVIEIYNASGQLVASALSAGNVVSFDASNYSKGLYFIKVIKKGSTETIKLIVE
ncbi:MAG: hypothetical protein ACJAZ2_000308 [Glaciecola sp.]|jgi:hypothetical protein